MFTLEIEQSSPVRTSDVIDKRIDELLKEVITERFPFEDKEDFLTWAEEYFPFITLKKDPSNSEIMHIVIFSWFSSELCSEYYKAILKKRLAARNQICELLTKMIGPFRDYNGGIILKQGENLEQFKRLFHDHPSDLIENFFYGLTPIEIQASIR